MNIKELVNHIDKQIASNDMREPNANWITNELKKYLTGKECCQWCGARVEGKVMLEIDDDLKFEVCQACGYDYVQGNFDAIKKKLKELKE